MLVYVTARMRVYGQIMHGACSDGPSLILKCHCGFAFA